MSDGLHKIHLKLSKEHAKKLLKGYNIQLKPEHLLQSGGAVLHVHLHKHRLHHKSMKAHKGYRLGLDEYEMHHNGGTLQDIINKVKDLYAGYKKNIKPFVGPYIRQGLKTLGKVGLDALSATNPEFAPILETAGQKILPQLVDVVGDKTGAYGLRHKRKPGVDGSMLAGPRHPAQHPVPSQPIGDGICHHCGSSFKVAGEGHRPKRAVKGKKKRNPIGGSFLTA